MARTITATVARESVNMHGNQASQKLMFPIALVVGIRFATATNAVRPRTVSRERIIPLASAEPGDKGL